MFLLKTPKKIHRKELNVNAKWGNRKGVSKTETVYF